jgi:stage III sporulation protein AG
VFAIDIDESISFSTEQDSEGGSRETRQQQSREETVMITDRQGTDRPLVLREIEPRIEGVVIIAEGGDSPFVRDALTRAARAVLGLDAHMIQVLAKATE